MHPSDFFHAGLHVFAVFRKQLVAVAVLIIGCSVVSPSFAQSNPESTVAVQVSMGLAGTWKVGFPVKTLVEVSTKELAIQGNLEIQTVDGDGVQVVYESHDWGIDLPPNSSKTIEAIIKHGRGNRPITIRLRDRDGKTLLERTLDASERGNAIPATQPWIVGIGSDRMLLDQAAMKSAKGALPEYSTTNLTRASELPVTLDGFGGVDLLVMSSRNSQVNAEISDMQAQAIADWIRHGGSCALTLGTHAVSWARNNRLASLIPGRLIGIVADCDQSPLESFIGSKSQLPKLECAHIKLTTGRTELTTTSPDRVNLPLIAQWAHGSGKIELLAVEIDGPEMSQWNSRPEVLKLLFSDAWERKDAKTDKLAYQGYDDLSGQLNATLDRFPDLTLGNLTSIAMIAGLLCLIIGPLDYFLVSKAWNRPKATWFTLLFCAILGCLAASATARSWKPSLPKVNSLELIDVDIPSRSAMGRAFAHFYGGERGSFNFSVQRRAQPARADGGNTSSLVRLDWFGQPGKGIGGFDSTVATDRNMPVYQVSRSQHPSESALATMRGVGIPAAGTKALTATWQETIPMEGEQSNSLRAVAGSIDLIEGAIVNPLSVDLLDGILIYRRRAYSLKTRLRPNERVELTASTLPRDVVRRLQRRQNVGGEERSTRWDPASTTQLDRLLELIAFHQSAGGSSYTSLYNRYLGFLDCSDVIQLDRAILLAEISEPAIEWSVQRDGIPLHTLEGQRKTFVRIFYPVASSKPLR